MTVKQCYVKFCLCAFRDYECTSVNMGAHGSKEKLNRSNSEKYPSKLPVPSDKKYKVAVNRERFGSFGARGKCILEIDKIPRPCHND